MRPKSFRKFVEDKEREVSTPYIDAISDELGINPDDLGEEPQVGSFYSMGKDIKNLGAYRVIKIIRNSDGSPTHAVVRTIEDRAINDRRYRQGKEGMRRIEGEADEKNFVVPIDELDKLLSQDFQPPPAAGTP
jgi:hypothetical protein